MPEIYLTQADKKKAKEKKEREKLLNDIRCGLNEYKREHDLTNEELGAMFGIGHQTIAKILEGKTIKIKTDQYLDILEISGIEIRKKGSVNEEKFYKEMAKCCKHMAKILEEF